MHGSLIILMVTAPFHYLSLCFLLFSIVMTVEMYSRIRDGTSLCQTLGNLLMFGVFSGLRSRVPIPPPVGTDPHTGQSDRVCICICIGVFSGQFRIWEGIFGKLSGEFWNNEKSTVLQFYWDGEAQLYSQEQNERKESRFPLLGFLIVRLNRIFPYDSLFFMIFNYTRNFEQETHKI